MLFSLKDLASKLSPNSQTKENLHTIKTNAFTLHQFETLSGLVFVINTNPDIPSRSSFHFFAFSFFMFNKIDCDYQDMHSHLQQIYSTIYIDCVARNPLYQFKTDEPIQCPLFLTRLEEYLFSLPFLKQ